MLESPSSTPPIIVPHPQFYSDGRPYPAHDNDAESNDSFDGGYITAAQIPASHRFADPDQPKLLLADPVPPLKEKRPLQDELGMLSAADSPFMEVSRFH